MRKIKRIYQAHLAKRLLSSLILVNLVGAAEINGPADLVDPTAVPTEAAAPIAVETDLGAVSPISPAIPPTPSDILSPTVEVPRMPTTVFQSQTTMLDELQSVCSGQTGYSQEAFFDAGIDLTPASDAPRGILPWCLDGSVQFPLVFNWKTLVIRNPQENQPGDMLPSDYVQHVLFNIPGSLQQEYSVEYLREQINHFCISAFTAEPMRHLGKLLPFAGFNTESHFWVTVLKRNQKHPNRRQQLILIPIEGGRRAGPIVFESYKLDRRISGITRPFSPKVALARIVQLLLADPGKLSGLQNKYFACNPQGEIIILKSGLEEPEISSIISQANDLIKLITTSSTSKASWDDTDMKKAKLAERELDLAGYKKTILDKQSDGFLPEKDKLQNFFILRDRQMYSRTIDSLEEKLICNNVLPTGTTDCIDPAIALAGKINDSMSGTSPWFSLLELSFPGIYQVKVYNKNPVKFLGYNKAPEEVNSILQMMDGIATKCFDEMPRRSIKLDFPSSH